MNLDWQINLTIIDKKAKKSHRQSVVFDAHVPCLSETIFPTIYAVYREGERALDIYKEVQRNIKPPIQ